MKGKLVLYLAGILACQGCGPLANVARTMIVEPGEYPRRLDNCVDKNRNHHLAEQDWELFQGGEGGQEYSHDFYLGFIDGFADYLYAGGTGAPPPVPPRWYWRTENESAEGRQAIQDWNDGFRTGAARARQSGYRELVTLPSSGRLVRPPGVSPMEPAGGSPEMPPPSLPATPSASAAPAATLPAP